MHIILEIVTLKGKDKKSVSSDLSCAVAIELAIGGHIISC